MNKTPPVLTHRMTVLLDARTRARLNELAARSGIPLSTLVRRALDSATDEQLTAIILDTKEDPKVRRGALDQYMDIERE